MFGITFRRKNDINEPLCKEEKSNKAAAIKAAAIVMNDDPVIARNLSLLALSNANETKTSSHSAELPQRVTVEQPPVTCSLSKRVTNAFLILYPDLQGSPLTVPLLAEQY